MRRHAAHWVRWLQVAVGLSIVGALGFAALVARSGKPQGTRYSELGALRTRATIGPVPQSATLAVDALLVGAAGWLERMGFRESGSDVQPNAVVAVERDRVIVRARSERRASESRKRPGAMNRRVGTKGKR
jgi:hypothetical protein